MLVSQFLVASFVAVAGATTLMPEDDLFFTTLLKRQEPGTPAYECHSACGTAITLSRGADPCNDDSFVTNYNNCLKCAGPGGANIWRYYGGTLSSAGSRCGFETEPASGGNEAVASSSSSSSSSPPPSSSSATPVSSPSHASVLVSGSSIASSVSVAPASTTVVSTTALTSSVSRTPSSSANATASITTSKLPEQSVNAASGASAVHSMALGAIVLGAMFGL